MKAIFKAWPALDRSLLRKGLILHQFIRCRPQTREQRLQRGVVAERCKNFHAHIWCQGQGKAGKPHEHGQLQSNNRDKQNQMNALCAALIATELTGDELRKIKILKLHQLLQACHYNVGIAVGVRKESITSMVIIDTGVGPNLNKEKCPMTAGTLLIPEVKSRHLRWASNNLMEIWRFLSLHLQIRQLLEKVRILVVPDLATNMLSITASISRYTVKLFLKAGSISPVNTGPAAIAESTKNIPAMTVGSTKCCEPVM